MKKFLLIHLMLWFMLPEGKCQVTYSANDKIPKYNGAFSFGTNGGYYPNWKAGELRDIFFGNSSTKQKGVGVTGIRYTLPNHFVEKWGYKINIESYKANKSMGAFDNTCFLEGASEVNRTDKQFCSGQQSLMFKDIYLPIWDNKDGTPINEANPYALYVYKTVSENKDYIKFWEIWNEPDHTNSSHGWEDATVKASWYNTNPDPCDLNNLKAPVFHYIRLLRISYEVIKFVDPSAYITTGGIGYESFLDAILRNTDNPDNGKISAEYPLKGGAYFDVLSYHSYPQYSIKDKRHSDAAVQAMVNHKNQFSAVLEKHGYDGKKYPAKEFIITEFNLARKTFGSDFGNEETQKNFILKAPVTFQQNGVRQMYIFGIADRTTPDKATSSYDLMGLYQDLNSSKPYEQKITTEGIAFSTASKLLFNYKYDKTTTQALKLPSNIKGGAFINKENKLMYVLWAATSKDLSEDASATYSFPLALNYIDMEKKLWNFSETGKKDLVSPDGIKLTATPVFLSPNLISKDIIAGNDNRSLDADLKLICSPNPFADVSSLTVNLKRNSHLNISILDSQGKLIKIVSQENNVSAGIHEIMIQAAEFESGVYYCRVTTEYGSGLQKLIIIK